MGSPRTGGSAGSENVSEPYSPSSSPDSGILIVLSGPSGVGKSTVVGALAARLPFRFSVSATTREPRRGERDGIDYFFVGDDEFDRMIARGELLEWAEYSGHRYGTPRTPVERWLESGTHVLLDIENLGAMQVKSSYPAAVTVFLAPPSPAELERRLRSRGDTDEESIRRRLEVASWQERMAREQFDHVVINDDIDRVIAEIMRIIGAPHQRTES